MRRTIVASRNILGIALIVFSEAYTDGLAFDLIRGKSADQFVNLFCTNDSCASNSCERHKATCGSEVCKYCVCNKDNHTSTYFPNNDSVYGECMQDLVIARNSGCFDSRGGPTLYTLVSSCSQQDCVKNVKIWSFNDSFNAKCILERLSFSISNQYWKHTEELLRDFSLKFGNTQTQNMELLIKIDSGAYKRWAGALLKLQIRCRTRKTRRPGNGDEFCTILKFTGKYRQATDVPSKSILVNTTLNSNMTLIPGQNRMRSLGDQYLASTIALSCILSVVFVFLGVGIYLLLRNNNNHSQDEHT